MGSFTFIILSLIDISIVKLWKNEYLWRIWIKNIFRNMSKKTCPICQAELTSTDDTWVLSELPAAEEISDKICTELMALSKAEQWIWLQRHLHYVCFFQSTFFIHLCITRCNAITWQCKLKMVIDPFCNYCLYIWKTFLFCDNVETNVKQLCNDWKNEVEFVVNASIL